MFHMLLEQFMIKLQLSKESLEIFAHHNVVSHHMLHNNGKTIIIVSVLWWRSDAPWQGRSSEGIKKFWTVTPGNCYLVVYKALKKIIVFLPWSYQKCNSIEKLRIQKNSLLVKIPNLSGFKFISPLFNELFFYSYFCPKAQTSFPWIIKKYILFLGQQAL